jgi:hypothetical protein
VQIKFIVAYGCYRIMRFIELFIHANEAAHEKLKTPT